MVMDFNEAAADASVQDLLCCIEDKPYETGALVTATGDPESDVSVLFETMVVDGNERPVFVIAITSAVRRVKRRLSCDELKNDVLAMYAHLQDELPADVREVLLDCAGPVVTINGVVHKGA
jgi:hypothetical protein